jgi:hypothetical protein
MSGFSAPDRTRARATVWTRNVVLTQSLAETDADGVEGFTEHVQSRASLDGSVPDTCTVEVYLDTTLTGELRNANYLVLRKYRPTERIL